MSKGLAALDELMNKKVEVPKYDPPKEPDQPEIEKPKAPEKQETENSEPAKKAKIEAPPPKAAKKKRAKKKAARKVSVGGSVLDSLTSELQDIVSADADAQKQDELKAKVRRLKRLDTQLDRLAQKVVSVVESVRAELAKTEAELKSDD